MPAKLVATVLFVLSAAVMAEAGTSVCTPAAAPPQAGFEILDPIFTTAPPCPEISGCPINCHSTGEIGAQDTGERVCQSGGLVFHCPGGKTIHVITLGCAHNACCFQFPACFCPANCGTAQTWDCR